MKLLDRYNTAANPMRSGAVSCPCDPNTLRREGGGGGGREGGRKGGEGRGGWGGWREHSIWVS